MSLSDGFPHSLQEVFKMNRRILSAALLTLILTALPAALFYEQIPAHFPIHWGFNGIADRWQEKNEFILFMIGVPVFFHAAALLLPRVDPLGSNYRRFASVYEFYIILFDIFMLAVFAAIIINAMTHFSFCMDTFILILLGIVFASMGNYMPLLRRNFFIGIRTPWALRSEETWNKTHRVAGRCWFTCGLLMIPCSFLGDPLRMYIFLLLFSALFFIPMLASFLFTTHLFHNKS